MSKRLRNSYKSWTVWFNGVILTVIPVIEYAKDLLPQLQEFLGLEAYKIIGLIILIANILLRFKTNKSLSEK